MQPQQEPRPKRFRLVKLEERIVPAHLPAVAVVNVPAVPGVELAQTHAHKVGMVLYENPIPTPTAKLCGATGGTEP
jgi:hypothetical protein